MSKIYRRHIVVLLFLAGLTKENIKKLGFTRSDLAILRNNRFMQEMADILCIKTFQFSLLSRFYGVKEDLLPMPYLFMQLMGISPVDIVGKYFPDIVIEPVKIEPIGFSESVKKWLKNRNNFIRRLKIYEQRAKPKYKKRHMARIQK